MFKRNSRRIKSQPDNKDRQGKPIRPQFGVGLKTEKERLQAAKARQAEIRRKQINDRLSQTWQKYQQRFTRFGIGGFVVLIVLIGVIVLHVNKVYIIKDITVIGNQHIPSDQLMQVLDQYKGQSMLVLSNKQIADKLNSNFTYLKSVFVRKVLPSKIEVTINERTPTILVINLSGVYLVDEEGKVIAVIQEDTASEGLTTEQSQIVAGYGDVNADSVKELYLSKIDKEEDRKKVEWDKVTLDKKQAVLDELRGVLTVRLEKQLTGGLEAANKSEFAELLHVFSYSNTEYKQGDPIPDFYLKYSLPIRDHFATDKTLTITRILWESEFLIKVETSQGKTILFSSIDPLDIQLRKLTALQANNIVAPNSFFDLRGEKIVVR